MLPVKQMTILDEPAAPAAPVAHREEMSPVVQQLENVAISDPSYQQGRTRDSRPSAATAPSFPGPPTSAAPQPEEPAKTFSPMAYNPAAPAAPEVIRYREKTPPPEDGATNPLVAAASADQGQSMAPVGYQQFAPPSVSAFGPNQTPYFSGPPQVGNSGSPYAAPPPSALNRAQSISHTLLQNVGVNVQAPQQAYGAYPSQAPMGSPGFAPPPQYSQQAPAPAASAPPAMQGGYSQYQYTQTQGAPLANDYSIHQQLYRPTEGEVAVKYKPAKEPRGKLEENAQKLEKGVTSLLKKLEKKYG